jgi:hypothetical protein
VGDSLARFGSGGERFTTLALISVSLLSLAHSVSLSHSLARSQSPSHSLSLAHSLPLTLTGGLGHAAQSFDGGIEGSEPHHTREPFLLGSHISAANFPQGRRRMPKLDQRVFFFFFFFFFLKKKKACKNSPNSGQISPESGGVSPESLLIRVST